MMFCLIFGLLSRLMGTMVNVDVTVRDEVGIPIENATVTIGTLRYLDFNAWDHKYYMKKTDETGRAHFWFYCLSGIIDCWVNAKGYYSFKHRESFPGPCHGFYKTFEKKNLEVNYVLLTIRNPKPMHVSSVDYRPYPLKSGLFGFDLLKEDWIAPYGKGDVADFWLDCENQETNAVPRITVRMIFKEPGTGCYVRKKKNSSGFWSDYYAIPTSDFATSRLFTWTYDKSLRASVFKYVHEDDEYLVLRLRTKINDAGRIVSAHYCKMYGVNVYRHGFSIVRFVYNPIPDDTNLESDDASAR